MMIPREDSKTKFNVKLDIRGGNIWFNAVNKLYPFNLNYKVEKMFQRLYDILEVSYKFSFIITL